MEALNCTASGTNGKKRKKRADPDFDTKLDTLLNPSKKGDKQKSMDQARECCTHDDTGDVVGTYLQARRMYRSSFEALDMEAAYSSMFELLWYSQLPCFDVERYTSTHRDHRCQLRIVYLYLEPV